MTPTIDAYLVMNILRDLSNEYRSVLNALKSKDRSTRQRNNPLNCPQDRISLDRLDLLLWDIPDRGERGLMTVLYQFGSLISNWKPDLSQSKCSCKMRGIQVFAKH